LYHFKGTHIDIYILLLPQVSVIKKRIISCVFNRKLKISVRIMLSAWQIDTEKIEFIPPYESLYFNINISNNILIFYNHYLYCNQYCSKYHIFRYCKYVTLIFINFILYHIVISYIIDVSYASPFTPSLYSCNNLFLIIFHHNAT